MNHRVMATIQQFCCALLLLVYCAPSGADGFLVANAQRRGAREPETVQKTPPARPTTKGTVFVAVADVLGRDLQAKVVLRTPDGIQGETITVVNGKAKVAHPTGKYEAFIYVYEDNVPILVEVKNVEITEGDTVYIVYTLLEGAGGSRPLRAFDQDFDLALDRVELAYGTDPRNAASIPGQDLLPFETTPLSNESRWFRGELHARSSHGVGSESVAHLIRRAEKKQLDFLAIADRNTMAAAYDPDFKSKSVVLIPAMEWGDDDQGIAILYGPRTMPLLNPTPAEAQAEVFKIQAQGGVIAIAHPCFSTAPWKRGLRYVNAVEIWCRDWRAIPPLAPESLPEALLARRGGRLVHSIAHAAYTWGLSANGQAAVFWDRELARGLKAGAIAGSLSSDPKVPLGEPMTYVFAREKSVPAIIEGLRNGHTFISSGPDGPLIYFAVDSNDDGKMDVNIGGVIPIGSHARFEVGVQRAKGKKLEILRDGLPIITKKIEGNTMFHRFWLPIDYFSVFRVRVIDTPKEMAFGLIEVLALTSPIYAQTIQSLNQENPMGSGIELRPSPGQQFDIEIPTDTSVGELIPDWRI